MTDLKRLNQIQELTSSIERETIVEVEITPQLLEELRNYDKLVVVRELDIFSGEWISRIAAQNSAGLTWPLPLAKD